MSLSTAEVESLRFHLGYGNISVTAYPYTPDGFYELFTQVVSPNLTTGAETSATTAITAKAITMVTPVSMTGITVNTRLVIDVGDDAETVVVSAVSGATFTARFLKAHAATGYPIAVESGVARLRLLLHAATTAWNKLQAAKISNVAGLQSVGKGEAVWFKPGATLEITLAQYRSIQDQLSSLVRVPVCVAGDAGRLEAY